MSARTLSELAVFAADTTLATIPDEVVASARLSLTDTLACILGGSTAEPVRTLAAGLDGQGEAPVAGTRFRTDPLDAALVNGIAGTWMDADTGGTRHPAGGRVPPVPTAHPPVHLLPALLASVGEVATMSGAELLRIYTLAYEIGARIGNATRLLPGIHPHGIHGTTSAAIAVGLARGLGTRQLGAAMELATALPIVASLRVAMIGATVRNAYAGIGARNGIMAVDASVNGTRAPGKAFGTMLRNGVSDTLDEVRLVANLGSDWELTRAYIKPHACARWIHSALDAMSAIRSGGSVTPDQIDWIEVRTFRFAAQMRDPRPTTDLAGKFSLPYCVAALCVYGRVELEAFSPEALRRPDLLALASRVRIVEDESYTAALPELRPTTVTAQLRDGRIKKASVEQSRGDPETPLRPDELEGKFLRLGGAALGDDRARRTLALLRDLRELSTVSVLLDSIAAERA